MLIIELMNSIFVTFVATECLLMNNNDDDTSISISNNNHQQTRPFILRLLLRYTTRFSWTLHLLSLIVVLINLFAHFSTTGEALFKWGKAHVGFFHIPRIVAAIITFLMCLWWDCRRIVHTASSSVATKRSETTNTRNDTTTSSSGWSNKYFLGQLIKSFFRQLPIYPFAAVIISFFCLFVITLFEDLHLDTKRLNGFIYYSTLYGPLMLIYWDVKGKFAKRLIINGVLPR